MLRIIGVGLVVVALAGVGATSARADGDPASDYLVGQRVFVGFGAPTDTAEVGELLALTAEAARSGHPIRIAVIQQVTDLGAISSLFGKAQQYATFLGQELRFVYHGTLVVVMGGKPGGVGIFGPGATPPARAAVRRLALPAAGDAAGLARTGAASIRAVATANGHPLTTPPLAAGHGGGNRNTLAFAVAGIAVALALAAGALLLFRRRR